MESLDRHDAADAVTALHEEIDRLVAQLAARHDGRLRCAAGCTDCCIDDLTVFEVEADRIRTAVGDGLRDICPLNGEPADIADLDAADCWTLGPFEERLAGLQVAVQRDEGFVPTRRVGLRELFGELAGG